MLHRNDKYRRSLAIRLLEGCPSPESPSRFLDAVYSSRNPGDPLFDRGDELEGGNVARYDQNVGVDGIDDARGRDRESVDQAPLKRHEEGREGDSNQRDPEP